MVYTAKKKKDPTFVRSEKICEMQLIGFAYFRNQPSGQIHGGKRKKYAHGGAKRIYAYVPQFKASAFHENLNGLIDQRNCDGKEKWRQ